MSTNRRRTRLIVLAAALVGLAMAVPATVAVADPAPSYAVSIDTGPDKPTVVLVHGAWSDGSSWAPVVSQLQRRGYPVLVEPNPLRGLASDAAYLTAYLQQHTSGPVVLAGHSYGGAVVSNAALSDPDVKALVYIDAFVPDQGESILGLLGGGGDPNALFDFVGYPGAPAGDVDLYIKTALFPNLFAGGLPASTRTELAAAQRPITLSALTEPSVTAAWKALPSWYFVGTDDQILPPALQLTMAQRAHSRTVQAHAPHLAMLARPDAVADLIVAAARATT
jgi:pimeloyl-ACP methyl ester carboxylesterase